MKRAIALAKRGLGRTSPNPAVGAVIVKSGKIIAEDYHRRAGMPHAEALALQKAGKAGKGSTLYVSLEPCCHTGKRTPPCTKAIIKAGIKKVFVSMLDPNPKVSGRGVAGLRAAGIDVEVGALAGEAKTLNEVYVKYITTGRPFVILKVAMTLDGKIATPEGRSKWITGEKARLLVHRLRSRVDAVLTAIGTVKADDPELTARIKGGRQPIRVVIDPDFQTPRDARILSTPPETIIVTREENASLPPVKTILFKEKLDLNRLMRRLASMGVTSVLIEGGSSLNAHALEDGIVDKVMFFIAPKIIGGRESYPAVGGRPSRGLEEAWRLRDLKVRRVGEDILVEGYIRA